MRIAVCHAVLWWFIEVHARKSAETVMHGEALTRRVTIQIQRAQKDSSGIIYAGAVAMTCGSLHACMCTARVFDQSCIPVELTHATSLERAGSRSSDCSTEKQKATESHGCNRLVGNRTRISRSRQLACWGEIMEGGYATIAPLVWC